MPLEWIFLQIFINSVEVGALFYLLCSKFTNKYNNLIPALMFNIILIVFISLPIFFPHEWMPIAEIIVPIASLMYLIFFREGRILKKIFWVLISISLLLTINIISIAIISITGDVDISSITILQPSNERLIVMIIAKTLQIVIFYILANRENKYEIKSFLSSIPLFTCLIVPLISFILMIFAFALIQNNFNIPEILIFAISVGYLAINVLVFVLYEIINKEAEKNYRLIAKDKQRELTEQHNHQVIEIYNKMREWRHDYNHHMQLIVSLLKSSAPDKNNEAVNYIKSLDEKIVSSSLNIVTGNLIVDAIVSAKAALASSHNIRFDYNISLKGDIGMDDTDLCSVLSNLLDNAIEACCKLNKDRYINLELIIFKNQFNIRVINSADGKYRLEYGKLATTKRGDFHGIGTGNVKSIVEEHGGIYHIKPEINSFTTQISIPLSRKS